MTDAAVAAPLRGHRWRQRGWPVAIGLVVAGLMVGAAGGRAEAAAGCATSDYPVGEDPVATATADVNGDGHPDVVTANRNVNQEADSVSVLVNDGEGGFDVVNQVGPVEPAAVAAADLDGDGLADLAIASTLQNTVSVMRGLGDGSFAPPVAYPTGAGVVGGIPFGPLINHVGVDPVDVIAADLTGDDAAELITANETSGDVSVLRNTGAGGFIGPLVRPLGVVNPDAPQELAAGDLDGDGQSDLAVAVAFDASDFSSREVAVLSGNGDGTFGEPTDAFADPRHDISASRGVVTAHLNGDAELDVATSREVLLNPEGDGFQQPTRREVSTHTGHVTAADITDDGPRDLAVARPTSGQVAVWAHADDATFTRLVECAAGASAVEVGAADVDGDGRDELITASEAADTVSVTRVQLTDPGGVTGTVTGADSGKVLADVEIRATPKGADEPAATAETGADGTYAIPTLAPDGYTVTADHGDYQPATQQVTVTGGATATVDFALQPTPDTGGIAGTVTAAHSDEALAGAEVTVTDGDDTVVGAATTGPNGGYTVAGLAPGEYGEYIVTADHPDYRPESQDASVNRGETTTVDLALRPEPGAVVGTVTDAGSGAPLAGIGVRVVRATGGIAGRAATGEAGGYRLEVRPPGEYTIVADSDSHRLESAEVSVAAGQTATVDLALIAEAVGCATSGYEVGDVPVSVATADFDGDGHPDAATANRQGETVSVLLGDGDGGFAAAHDEPATHQPDVDPAAVVATDLDGDDVADLAVANQSSGLGGHPSVAVLRGHGDGTFVEPVEYPLGANAGFGLLVGAERPVDLIAADLDGDGDRDLATANAGSKDVAVLANTGAGAFAGPQRFAVNGAAQALTAARLDGDQHPDLAVTTAAGQVAVLAGNGDATFQTPDVHDTGDDPRGILAVDLDGDGDRDLATANAESDDVAVLENAGDDFTDPAHHVVGAGTAPYDLAAADFDGDGDRDLVTANGVGEAALLAGDGDATFTRVADCAAGGGLRAMALADVDGDAHPDVLAANTGGNTLSVGRITGSLDGTVTDAASGAPVAGAAVTVTDADGDTAATADTDSDGDYTIADLPAATYTVTADHPDYQPASDEAGVVGAATATVDFALEPAATPTGRLAGTVTDADSGEPVGGAEVTVADTGGTQAASVSTAGDGGYEITELAAGDYTLTVDAGGYQAQSRETTVTAGATTTEDVALVRQAGAIDGQVTDADTGEPVGDAAITVTDADGTDAGSATTGGDGGYEIAGLEPGDYTATADHPDYQADSTDASVTAGETTPVDFGLTPTSDDGGSNDDSGGSGDGGSDGDGSGDSGSDGDGSGDGGSDGDGDSSDGGSGDGDGGGSSDSSDEGGSDGGLGGDDTSDDGGGHPAGPAAAEAGVSRIAGGDRFATAAALSQRAYPDGAEVVYVATGFGFADALTGGVAAAADQAPLLLVTRSDVPAVTAGELDRLAPDRLVILGGRGVIDASVAQTLAGHAGRVDRLAGADRFATARAVAEVTFPDAEAVDTVYVASGHTFADALAGGPAATEAGAPLLLATAEGLPAPTRAALDWLAPDRVVLLGGPAALGEPVAEAAAGFADTVDRLAGPTRFATAAAIAADTSPEGADQVLVATGTAFPDALAGGAVAGAADQPVLLATPGQLTSPTRTAVGALAPISAWLLGGPAALNNDVETELDQLLTDGGDT